MKNRVKLPFTLRMIQGAIGKSYVIKHYKWGIIKTKFPDMTKIIASPKQRTCRNLFREAVAYAKTVIADEVKKKEWQKRLRRRNGVYNEAVKAYMLKDKLAKERERLLTNRLIRNAFKNQSTISLGSCLHSPEVSLGSCLHEPKFTAIVAETMAEISNPEIPPPMTNNYEALFIAPG